MDWSFSCEVESQSVPREGEEQALITDGRITRLNFSPCFLDSNGCFTWILYLAIQYLSLSYHTVYLVAVFDPDDKLEGCSRKESVQRSVRNFSEATNDDMKKREWKKVSLKSGGKQARRSLLPPPGIT